MPSWHALHGAYEPPLFLKYNITKFECSVHLSDLNRVWEETLSRRDVIRRAIIDGCSVDPTESDDQYGILLEKIRDCLSQATNTTLSLSKGEARDQLTLQLATDLPKPLPPFQWNINLSLRSGHHVARELVMPLLRSNAQMKTQIQQLVSEIAVKDKVIFKITDRLEASGQDLSLVFPNVSNMKISRKKSQREQYAPHINGLAEFNYNDWRSRQVIPDDSELSKDAMDEIFKELSTPSKGDSQDAWWLRLGRSSMHAGQRYDSGRLSVGKSEDGHTTDPTTSSSDTGGLNDDAFQRQNTPPGARKSTEPKQEDRISFANDNVTHGGLSPTMAAVENDESATEEEDDLDSSSHPKPPRNSDETIESKSPYARTTSVPSRSFGKLGTIGGRPVTSRGTTGSNDERGVGESKDQPGAANQPGVHANQDSDVPETHSESPLTTIQQHDGKRKAKLGTIGGKLNAPQSVDNHAKEHKSSTMSKSPSEEVVSARMDWEPDGDGKDQAHATKNERELRETSQERADRRRDELKKEIEAKSKVPAKKRRKF